MGNYFTGYKPSEEEIEAMVYMHSLKDETEYATFEEFVEAKRKHMDQFDTPRETWIGSPDMEFHYKKFGIKTMYWGINYETREVLYKIIPLSQEIHDKL
jgi:hypothetical protein